MSLPRDTGNKMLVYRLDARPAARRAAQDQWIVPTAASVKDIEGDNGMMFRSKVYGREAAAVRAAQEAGLPPGTYTYFVLATNYGATGHTENNGLPDGAIVRVTIPEPPPPPKVKVETLRTLS